MNDQSLRRLLMETMAEDDLGLHELSGLLPDNSGTDVEIREQLTHAIVRCLDRGWLEAYQSETELDKPDAMPPDDVALLLESKSAWKFQGDDILRFTLTEAGQQALEDDADEDDEEVVEEADPSSFID